MALNKPICKEGIRQPDLTVPKDGSHFKELLSDPWWRLTSGHLYKITIKGDDGEENLKVPFIPNNAQLKFLSEMHTRNIILKARQLGFTTLIEIFILDCCIFKANVSAAVVAQTDDVCKKIFKKKVRFAHDNLPPSLNRALPLSTENTSELEYAHNKSSIIVSISARGDTLHYLHVSEFGKICAKYPERAAEIITGSIPAVPINGMIFIESTSEGQDGDFYKMTMRAQNLMNEGRNLTPKDYKLHFYPWWSEEKYTIEPEGIIITTKEHQYFDGVESSEGCILSLGQRSWWIMTRDADFTGEESKMWQEYPSSIKEAFKKSKEGCYYTVQMAQVRKRGGITKVPHRPGYPVNTFWDIGNHDGTGIWLHQKIGQMDHFIGYIEGWDETYSYYVGELNRLDYTWGVHYLPHDADHERQGEVENISPMQMLKNLGLSKFEIVPVVAELGHGIQATRDAFSTCIFDEVECKEGIIHLDSYRKKFNRTTGRYMDTHLKDEHTEGADSFRQFGQMNIGGKLDKKKAKSLNFASLF